MNWIKYKEGKWSEPYFSLEEGMICRTLGGNFVMVGEINTSMGTNDEFTEEITHYSTDYVDVIKDILKQAKSDFKTKRNETEL